MIDPNPLMDVLHDAQGFIEAADHKPDCPRIRDDHECLCGKDTLVFDLQCAIDEASMWIEQGVFE